jgi:hypothetical protein
MRVSIVANIKPPMMVTAMEEKKASNMSGIMPSMVVAEAMATGLILLTAESTMA